MNNDGADSPLPPPLPAPAASKAEGDESVTLARSAQQVPLPPRPPMPQARIRPTASFPRLTMSGVPAVRAVPSMTSLPAVTPLGSSIPSLIDAADDAPDAVTNHLESVVTTKVATPAARLDITVAASTPKPAPWSLGEPRQASLHEAPAATALVQGDIIGGLCRIDERLAISEMSVLYRAFHLQLERMVVVKVLQDAGVENLEAVARFRREARLMSLVTSEHVAKVLDVGSHDGCPFIVMERLEGADLAYLLKQVGGRLSVKQACDLVLQICEALAVAHSHGIVHRDLKPANVFVSVRAGGDLRVTIIDFGIAKAFFQNEDTEDQLTKVNGLLGSPRYMAPEQVEPRMEVDERADIWALGILFQEMLTGERVFASADGIVPMLMAIVESPPIPLRNHLPDAPDAIVATIAGALEKDATRRLPNALTFAARVAPFASPDALQRVANIAAIAASAVERAADSRPAMSERATLPPTPRIGLSTEHVLTVAPPSPRGAALASSNPPPTMRLPREVILAEQAAAAPTPLVPPPPPPPPPLSPVPSAAEAASAPAAAAAPAVPAVPVVAVAALETDDAVAVAAMRRSPFRSPVVILLAIVGVVAGAAVTIFALTSGGPDPSGSPSAPQALAPPVVPPVVVPSASAAPTPTMATAAETAPSSSANVEVELAEAGAEPIAAASASSSATKSAPLASTTRPAPSASAASAPIASSAASTARPDTAPATKGIGKLTVVCLPKCDQILDNGAVLGNGYVFGQEVAAGHHTLTLSTPGGAKKTLSVDVPADGTKDVRVSMDNSTAK